MLCRKGVTAARPGPAVYRRLGTAGVPRLVHDRGHRRQAARSRCRPRKRAGPDRDLRFRFVAGQRSLAVGALRVQAERGELAAYLSTPPANSAPTLWGPHTGDDPRRQLLAHLSTRRGPLAPHPTGLWLWPRVDGRSGRSGVRALGPEPSVESRLPLPRDGEVLGLLY